MRSILHCDMNNFYASVECMLNPELKGHPVAVGGSVEERHGIILAKNYQAKAFGIQTGEAIWEAERKCKDLIVVPPHYDQYIKYSKLAKEVYCRYTDQVEPYGMDECWLDISGSIDVFGTPEKIANEIRETMKEELGLTISVGVSFNKIFAKLGSDLKKPDAVTCIHYEKFKEEIWGLPVEDLLFVGRSTKKFCDRFCIRTIGDLANTDYEFLKLHLGKHGTMLWRYANGYDSSPVMEFDYAPAVKSVGHGTTTSQDLENNRDVWMVMLELCQDIGHRLKELHLVSTGVAIYIRDKELFGKQWQMQFDFATQSPFVIAKMGYNLFLSKYSWKNPIRSVTVRAISLLTEDTPIQLNFFRDQRKIDNQNKIDDVVENLRSRFGKQIIRNAILLDTNSYMKEQAKLTMPTGMMNMR